MKWYNYLLIAIVLVLVLVLVQNSNNVEEITPEVVAPATQVVSATSTDAPKVGTERNYDLYVTSSAFMPVTFEAQAGDTVRLTLSSDTYDTIDFQIPELKVVTELDAGENVEFEVPVAGNFDFFCMTCSPSLQGNILVHE